MLPYAAWLCWGFPILGAVLSPVFGKIHPKLRDYAAVLFGLLGMIFAFSMIPYIWSGAAFDGHYWQEVTYPWIDIPGVLTIEWGMLVDPLSVFMACVATGVSFLILAYSLGYMKGDPSLTRYWFFMQLFVGGMVLLVMANNLLVTFIGWEIVGLCSYALIGFWYNRTNMVYDEQLGEVTEGQLNSHSGMKAFIVTRIGDVGLLIAIIFIFFFTVTAGNATFNYQALLADFDWLGYLALAFNGVLMIAVFILFLLGPIGKSAQFPLQLWLPEAMAGPTTVSALIHAAAMVKAGVYLVARMLPIIVTGFLTVGTWAIGPIAGAVSIIQSMLPSFFVFVGFIGGFTAFLAATMAMVSRELKKVLAFSTISQLGYMFMSLGVFSIAATTTEGYGAAVFHLASHAVFKALLFLSAGAVLHSVHSKYMDDMGGIRKAMPITFGCMVIGALALSGVPPLSGFWSKEAIFAASWALGVAGNTLGWVFLFVAAVTGILTFFYSLRMIGLTFLGDPSKNVQQLEKEGKPVHEAPRVMWIPLVILMITTFVLGFLTPFLEQFFFAQWHHVYPPIHAHMLYLNYFMIVITSPTFLITLLVLLIGGIPGYLFYIRRSWNPNFIGEKGLLRGLYNFLYNRWYYNKAMYKIFVDGGLRFSNGMFKYAEAGGIDKLNYVIAGGAQDLSRSFRRIQTGVHSWNMILLLIGAIVLLFLLVFFYFIGGVLMIPIPFLP